MEERFDQAGASYLPARLTIFRDEVDTACGRQPAYIGPFYCPADHGVYLDTRFFDALSRNAGVQLGDFAQAFVIAHEVAHHVQVLLGITQRVRAEDAQDPAGENARSVRLELQADCFAGIWKHFRYQRGELSDGAFQDALNAAAVVGSDFQQRLATGVVAPEDWTHGSSAQRQQWLTTRLSSKAVRPAPATPSGVTRWRASAARGAPAPLGAESRHALCVPSQNGRRRRLAAAAQRVDLAVPPPDVSPSWSTSSDRAAHVERPSRYAPGSTARP